MRQFRSVFIVACIIAVVSLAGGAALAQTTSTEVKQFEVVSVDGNTVVVKGADGAAREITVADEFRLTVDGKPVSVRDLKPGMKGVANIKTITTETPVTVTEVKKGRVLQATANSIIVRTEEGNRMFTETEVTKRGVKITTPDGRPMKFSELRQGYELTATIVTQKPPQVMTTREVEAALKSVPAPAAAPRAAGPAPQPPAAPVAPTAAQASPAPAPQLPKTASPWPLIALIGTAALALAGMLRMAQKL